MNKIVVINKNINVLIIIDEIKDFFVYSSTLSLYLAILRLACKLGKLLDNFLKNSSEILSTSLLFIF
jgi:hypothetical protein